MSCFNILEMQTIIRKLNFQTREIANQHQILRFFEGGLGLNDCQGLLYKFCFQIEFVNLIFKGFLNNLFSVVHKFSSSTPIANTITPN